MCDNDEYDCSRAFFATVSHGRSVVFHVTFRGALRSFALLLLGPRQI